MKLTEMSKIYLEDVNRLNEQIARRRGELKKVRGKEVHRLNRELCILYEMRRDCNIVSQMLREYYQSDSRHNLP